MYIGVIQQEGIISDVIVGETVQEVEQEIYEICPEDKFNPESDDARIFDDNNKEVKSLYDELVDAVYAKEK